MDALLPFSPQNAQGRDSNSRWGQSLVHGWCLKQLCMSLSWHLAIYLKTFTYHPVLQSSFYFSQINF